MILMYELTAGYKCKTSGTYQHEVYRRPYFNLGACFNKITALSEMLCESGDSDATI